MSSLYDEAEAALSYQAPEELGAHVLAVIYGETIAVPDLVDTIEVWFSLDAYPGTFVVRELKAGAWQTKVDFHIAYTKWEVAGLYAVDGGPWPARDPLPPVPPPSPGPIGYG